MRIRAGFSLVELLVTLSIFALVFAAAIPNLRSTNLRRALMQSAEEVKAGIYEAKQYSLAPQTEKTTGSDGYIFRITSPSSYEILEASPTGTTQPGQLIRTGQLPAGITYVTTPVFTEIIFSIEGQGRVISPQPANGQLTLTLTHPKIAAGSGRNIATLTMSTVTGQIFITEPQ